MSSYDRRFNAISNNIGWVVLFSGILFLIFSIYYTQVVPAFIGLGLTFWGLILILLKPERFVDGNLLESTAFSTYLTIDRITSDFNYQGRSFYIPPYPKDVYLPEHLRGLKDLVVFISNMEETKTPSIDELAKGKFRLNNPNGVLVNPPGWGLLRQIERKWNGDFTGMDLNEMQGVLVHYLSEEFGLIKSLEMNFKENEASVKIGGSLYFKLYDEESNLTSIKALGCPVLSAIACALAKASGKLVIIEKQTLSSDNSETEAILSMVKA